MATYDLRKTTKASSGQKIREEHSNNNNQNKTEERVVILESKIDKILSLLENKKDD